MAREDSILQSVDNALRLLESFSVTEPELGIAELSRKLGLSKSTVFRLASTLQARGFLAQNPANDKYRLGMKAVYIGGLALRQINLVKDSRQFLETLVLKAGEAAHLAVLDQGYTVFINKAESGRAMSMGSSIGARMPAYITATGKTMLAHLPDEELEAYLRQTEFKRYTANTITDPERLRACLMEIRARGYGTDLEESEEGLMCIAAPVRNNHGKVIAAISISGSAPRMHRRFDEFRQLVMEQADSLSQLLGWNPSANW